MNAPAGLLAVALSAFRGAACCLAAQAQVRVNPHDAAGHQAIARRSAHSVLQ
jgi:hypothetical protein